MCIYEFSKIWLFYKSQPVFPFLPANLVLLKNPNFSTQINLRWTIMVLKFTLAATLGLQWYVVNWKHIYMTFIDLYYT